LKLINEKIGKSGSGYLASSGLTWADLHLINVLDFFGDQKAAILSNFKHVKELDAKVRANPKIAEWINKRPKSDY
jgi:hypothetical protein